MPARDHDSDLILPLGEREPGSLLVLESRSFSQPGLSSIRSTFVSQDKRSGVGRQL